MKPTLLSPPALLATGLLLAAVPAVAQMADGFDPTPPSEPEKATTAQAAAKPEAAAATAEIQPSRHVPGDELTAYVRQLSARLLVRKQETDPFGRFQDPDRLPPAPKIVSKSPGQSFKPEPPMPFSDVVAGISINTVIPGKQQFLIGNREFRVNDAFSLRLPNGKELKVRVVSVSSARIRFLNLATNETADLALNMLPAGMQKGTGKISAPGMDTNDSSAPIEIQPVIPLSTNP